MILHNLHTKYQKDIKVKVGVKDSFNQRYKDYVNHSSNSQKPGVKKTKEYFDDFGSLLFTGNTKFDLKFAKEVRQLFKEFSEEANS